MNVATIPLSFAGEPPDLRAGDELIPPDTLELHGFVWFQRGIVYRDGL
jgi:hypothetical protein